ncbi:scavenger receptor cysteine-rich domain superfamily protein-like [Mytilus californianus]|uniref:scavenger receptor cysteine-rich domain superfamily protein-like n=1 Tax=Mytilus californianus TaxID=6549 RepID=UPI0022463B89|nr:scavenger receptor cysteine-rich domain superfamily protein-like [Mytilus californianus]
MNNLGCWGTEDDLGQCNFSPWGLNNCSHQQDVGIACGISVRLIGGASYNEGRVEIHHANEWGTICETNFSKNEGMVVCRMLGLDTDDAVMYPHAQYGPGTGKIFFTNLHCAGTEKDLENCKYSSWDNSQCTHNNDMSIDCATPVRLLGGRGPFEGTVELYHLGKWGEVCDTNFDVKDAEVICRMLGYTAGIPRLLNSTDSGTGLVWIDNLHCNGDETDVALCKSDGFGSMTCSHKRKAAIYCAMSSFNQQQFCISYMLHCNKSNTWPTPVRLAGGGGPWEGRIEVFHNGVWGTVCDTGFGNEAAGVVCRMLGFLDGMNTAILYKNAWFGQGNGVSFDLQTECSGKESKIFFCPLKNTFGKQNCQHTEDVGVQCVATPLGQSKGNGRLEIKYNGKWGTVCSEQWTSQNSKAVCRMLGYQNRTIETNTIQRNGTAVVLGSLDCLGVENDIGFCKGDLDKSQCNDDIVNIDCSGGIEVRLSGGSSPADGRIDIKENGQWGSLCDKNFGLSELQVLCNTLGYRDTLPYLYHLPSLEMHRATFGIDQLTCSGLEDHIAQCQISKTASCHHRYAHLKCFDCVQQYYSATGTVMSDNYPGRYNPNTDCLYIIQPPPGLYTLSVDVFQMADTGDFLQIKDSPFGKELGKYSVSSYIPVALSNQFWIRFKTNGQKSARGFKLHWSPFDFKDLLSLNCEVNRWGAAINITLLKMANLQVNYSDIYMMDPDCYGQIVGDTLLFNQPYSECGSTKNISHFYITYQNNITFISEGVTHDIPLECKLFKDDRILHYHQIDGNLELDDDNANGSEKSLFHVDLYYDSELTQTDDKQFSGKFVYRIAVNEDHYDHYLLLTHCYLTMKKDGLDETLLIVKNS